MTNFIRPVTPPVAPEPIEVKRLKEKPFFQNLTRLDRALVKQAMDQPALSASYATKIRAGDWKWVITEGLKQEKVEYTLMGAYALELLTADEVGSALLFIDCASDAMDRRFSIIKEKATPGVPDHLCYYIQYQKMYHESILANYERPGLAFMETIPLINEDLKQKNGDAAFTLYPSFRYTYPPRMISHVKQKLSDFALYPIGSTMMVHEYKASGVEKYLHDKTHAELRAEAQENLQNWLPFAEELNEYLTVLPKNSNARPQLVEAILKIVEGQELYPEEAAEFRHLAHTAGRADLITRSILSNQFL